MSKSEAWVKLPRELLESEAWRSLSLNSRRLVDYLMVEHMRHRGKRNGELLAPRRSLELAGIHADLISGAIDDAERVGVIGCRGGIGRRPNTFALT